VTGRVSFLRDARGSATVEFAFVSILLFAVLMVGLDFAYYAQQRLKLGSAVEQGAVIAFSKHANAPTVDQTSITNYIQSTVSSDTTVSYQCNGGTCGTSTSKCIGAQGTNSWPTFSNPSSGTTCSSGASSGYYLVIQAKRTYHSVVVPDSWLGGTQMMQQAVVRLS
jgi:Flp pilus assembly protein TadG